MRYSANSRTVTILRRPVVAPADDLDGVARGDYAVAFSTIASLRPMQGREATEAGVARDEIDIEVTVQATARNRTITGADRLAIGRLAPDAPLGALDTFDIRVVSLPDRAGGSLRFTITRRPS